MLYLIVFKFIYFYWVEETLGRHSFGLPGSPSRRRRGQERESEEGRPRRGWPSLPAARLVVAACAASLSKKGVEPHRSPM